MGLKHTNYGQYCGFPFVWWVEVKWNEIVYAIYVHNNGVYIKHKHEFVFFLKIVLVRKISCNISRILGFFLCAWIIVKKTNPATTSRVRGSPANPKHSQLNTSKFISIHNVFVFAIVRQRRGQTVPLFSSPARPVELLKGVFGRGVCNGSVISQYVWLQKSVGIMYYVLLLTLLIVWWCFCEMSADFLCMHLVDMEIANIFKHHIGSHLVHKIFTSGWLNISTLRQLQHATRVSVCELILKADTETRTRN